MALSDITDSTAVLQAAHEFDALGRGAFLDRYGFGKAREYFLVISGKRYDSKAIMGCRPRLPASVRRGRCVLLISPAAMRQSRPSSNNWASA